MPAQVLADPFAGLTAARVKQLIRDYENPTLTVNEVMVRNKVGSARLRAILDARKIRPRGARPFGLKKRSMAQVFLGMQPAAKASDDAVEKAKTALRRRGCVVYDAEVVEGSKGRGFVRVDHKRLTPAEVIKAARAAR